MSNSTIRPIDGTLSCSTTPGRVDLGVMAMKGYPHSRKLQHCWSLTIGLFNVISRTLAAEMDLVHSTGPADWAIPVRVTSLDQIDLFENYWYWIGIHP